MRAIANPLRDLTSDAETVADFLKTVQGPIVLAGHSYGGSVITNAAANVPGVKALVYVDAAAPDIGETTARLSGSGSALGANPSWYFISTGDRIITPDSQRSMAGRARSKVTTFQGGSHLTLISHPDAVTSVIGSAICSVR